MDIKQRTSEIIDREGREFVNHPADRGGPTKFGVTAETLGDWRKLGRHATAAEVKALQEPEARLVLEHMFYLAPNFDQIITSGYELLGELVIDMGVVSGPRNAARRLQRVVGVEDDGKIGKITLAKMRNQDQWLLVKAYVGQMVDHFFDCWEARDANRVFLRGWITRALSLVGIKVPR